MTAGLLNGDDAVAGTMTSGGSESLLMAVKTYRDKARAERPDLTDPEMILPVSAHPAILKAAHYLGVRPVLIPVGEDFRVDPEAVERAITPRTIFLVGSAPSYPQGVIDPIERLGELAQAHGLGLHVDACLGGFLLPFLERLGHPIPRFDFRVKGVTSISADLHKYGFAAKGASTILYRTEALRQHQFFVHADWPGGLFASTTMLGTRPGGAIAAAWAALTALGEQGYLRMAEEVLQTTRALQEGIGQIADLRILGRPAMSVFAFTAEHTNLLAVADAMELRGWHIDRQQRPSAIHLMITPAHRDIVPAYLHDLKECVSFVSAHPELAAQGSAAMYGMLAQIPEGGMVRELVLQHLGGLYR
jgi:glutamate/tyrosine decarboxylase-like PLP-dependent enzyme